MDPQIFGDVDEQITADYVPSIDGMGMEKTVTVYNPMPVDFRVRYVRSVAVNAPISPGLKVAQEKAGLDLSRRGGTTAHVSHTVVLKANSMINLPGDIAQIAVHKLISAIIQTRNDDGSYDFSGHGGNKGMVPDPFQRKEVENEIVKGIKDTMSLMNTETPEAFTSRQINEMNEGVQDDGQANPAPGTGVTYTPTKDLPGGSGQSGDETTGTPEVPEAPAKRKPGRPKAPAVSA